MPGCFLSELSWIEARTLLTSDTLVVIPLGAEAKEHGPHLKLANDRMIADYLARRVAGASEVVVAPTITYHYYPAFVEYAGSTTLRLETARDLVIDIVQSLAAFGPRRFYVLNTGVSTLRPLRLSAEDLQGRGIVLRFTEMRVAGAKEAASVTQQEGGTHADEIETSMMLYIAPDSVNMSKAARDFTPGGGKLTPHAGGDGIYSPSGIYGDATLATAEKGRVVVEAMVRDILAEIEALRGVALP